MLHCAAELVGQHRHELQPERRRLFEVEVLGDADAVVADGEQHVSGDFGREMDRDLTFLIARERMLQGDSR